jgi:hypothetical protein
MKKNLTRRSAAERWPAAIGMVEGDAGALLEQLWSERCCTVPFPDDAQSSPPDEVLPARHRRRLYLTEGWTTRMFGTSEARNTIGNPTVS